MAVYKYIVLKQLELPIFWWVKVETRNRKDK